MTPYETGFAAAKNGNQCPYLPFSDEAVQWMLGYSAGQL